MSNKQDSPKHGMKARIARELGISGAAVSKLARQGMPIDDVDAARRWRVANLNPARMRPDPGPSADTLLQRAQRLADLAHEAQERHALAIVADELRAAMRAVPMSHREGLRMAFALWEALIGPHAMMLLRESARAHPVGEVDNAAEECTAAAVGGEPGADEDDVGEFLYTLACGEAYLR